jgi:hypothetical protein
MIVDIQKIAVWLAVILGFLPAVAVAQPGRGCCMGARNYDPATETTLKGVVGSVTEYPGRRASSGVHFMLKTEAETVDVHVGPSWFLADKKFALAQGDEVQVTGSKIKMRGGDVLLAREIKKGDQTLTLRNAQGIPLWARGGPPAHLQ